MELRSALDRRVLAELRSSVSGDQEFLAELIDDFLQDAPALLETLRTAASSGDADAARRAAHTLKGTSRTFGAEELAALCQGAEAAAGIGDLESVRSRVDEIEVAWGRARTELLALRDGRG
jgi:HPt (histidine-containing phosphotransfer) domain-containing protein